MLRHAGLFSQLVALFNPVNFANWPKPKVYGKSTAACPAAWASCATWGLNNHPTNSPCPMLMHTGPCKCLKSFLSDSSCVQIGQYRHASIQIQEQAVIALFFSGSESLWGFR
jgi:hypothetical protein